MKRLLWAVLPLSLVMLVACSRFWCAILCVAPWRHRGRGYHPAGEHGATAGEGAGDRSGELLGAGTVGTDESWLYEKHASAGIGGHQYRKG